MADETRTEVYRLHVWICRISPMIWLRLLVRSDSTLAALHYALQTAFGWSDEHLNEVHIHGQDYGVCHDGGIILSADPAKVRLSDFKFRRNESFRYEYDFVAGWEHQIRVDECLALEDKRRYPRCIGRVTGSWGCAVQRKIAGQHRTAAVLLLTASNRDVCNYT